MTEVLLGELSSAIQGRTLFSRATFAAEAKILVTSLSSWIMIQAGVHLQQSMIAGAAVGWADGRFGCEQSPTQA